MRPVSIVLAASALAIALPVSGAGPNSVSTMLAAPAADEVILQKGLTAFRSGDYAIARAQFRTLAARGNPAAETLLGTMAANGQGGPRDQAVAAAWFLRAASRGYAPAQMALANSFARGHGVGKDLSRAKVLAQAAAAQGQPGAAQLAARVSPQNYAQLLIQP